MNNIILNRIAGETVTNNSIDLIVMTHRKRRTPCPDPPFSLAHIIVNEYNNLIKLA